MGPPMDGSSPAPKLPWWPLAIPLVMAGLLLGSLLLLLGERAFLLQGLLIAYLIPPLSKETVLPLAVAAGYDPFLVGAAFTATDLVLAVFVAWNFDRLYALPSLGPRLRWWENLLAAQAARSALARRMRLGAVFLFMAVPMIGSGAATASLLGRGLGERALPVFGAVAAGSIVLNFAYAYLAEALVAQARAYGPAGIVAVVLLIGGFAVLTHLRKRAEAARPGPD
jgi:hypothetical protein